MAQNAFPLAQGYVHCDVTSPRAEAAGLYRVFINAGTVFCFNGAVVNRSWRAKCFSTGEARVAEIDPAGFQALRPALHAHTYRRRHAAGPGRPCDPEPKYRTLPG
jgi:hypothetical protein